MAWREALTCPWSHNESVAELESLCPEWLSKLTAGP